MERALSEALSLDSLTTSGCRGVVEKPPYWQDGRSPSTEASPSSAGSEAPSSFVSLDSLVYPSNTAVDGHTLTAWEAWMVRKAREDATKRKALQKQQCEVGVERGREGRLREEHQQRVRQSYTDWLRRKAAARRKECQQERESVLHKMAVEVEEQSIHALKVQQKYSEWCCKKDDEVGNKLKELHYAQKNQDKEQAKIAQRSQLAYDDWLKSKSVARGRLHHGATCSTGMDHFCNTQPWLGPLDG